MIRVHRSVPFFYWQDSNVTILSNGGLLVIISPYAYEALFYPHIAIRRSRVFRL